ncbi:MAG: hypothetical protein ACE5EL_03015 [Anaerolineae bacterium]
MSALWRGGPPARGTIRREPGVEKMDYLRTRVAVGLILIVVAAAAVVLFG